jgi:hypothetical protein
MIGFMMCLIVELFDESFDDWCAHTLAALFLSGEDVAAFEFHAPFEGVALSIKRRMIAGVAPPIRVSPSAFRYAELYLSESGLTLLFANGIGHKAPP